MNARQQMFADEFIKTGNATQSAIASGYSEKTARSIGQQLLTKVDIKKYIDEQMGKIHNNKIADAQEVLEYLTSVLRGESLSSEIVVEHGEAREIMKTPSEKDRLKSAELIGKRYGIYVDKQEMNLTTPIVIKDDL